MRTVGFLIACSLISGCLEQPAEPSLSIIAQDPSTTYQSLGAVAYYDNTGTTPYQTAYFNLGLETLTVTGATYTFVRNGNGCTSTETGNIEFNAGTSTYQLTNRSVDNSPDGSCQIDYQLTAGSVGSFTPSNWSLVIPEGTLNDFSDTYYENSTRLGLLNTDTSASSYPVFYVFTK